MKKNLKKIAAYVLMLALILAWAFDFIPFLRLGSTEEASASSILANGGTSAAAVNGSCSDNSSWSGTGSPGNASANDTSYIQITGSLFDSGNITDELRLSNFGFSIPSGSTIDGITVDVLGWTPSGASTVNYNEVQLFTAPGTNVGANKSTGSLPGADPGTTYTSFGGSADTWSKSGGWTYTEINSSGFGVALCFIASGANRTINIDHVRITVYYTEPQTTLSGTVYQSEWGTNIGSGKTVSVYKNGSTSLGSAVTDASGVWTLSFPQSNLASGDIITAYIDNDATYKGNIVFVSDGTNKSDVDIYGGDLIVRHDTGSNITNANLTTGLVSSDPTDMEYSVSGSDLSATSLYIWTGDTYAPGGNIILSGNFTNDGTFSAGTGTLTFTNNLLTSTISSASDITFNNISSVAYGKHFQFQKQIANSPKFIISGTFSVSGIYGNPIYISSDTAGSEWLVYFNSAQTLSNIHLADSGCSSGSATVADDQTIGDGGNNGDCWGILSRDAPGPSGDLENIGGGTGTLHTGGSSGNVRSPTGQNPHAGGSTQTGGGQGGDSVGTVSP